MSLERSQSIFTAKAYKLQECKQKSLYKLTGLSYIIFLLILTYHCLEAESKELQSYFLFDSTFSPSSHLDSTMTTPFSRHKFQKKTQLTSQPARIADAYFSSWPKQALERKVYLQNRSQFCKSTTHNKHGRHFESSPRIMTSAILASDWLKMNFAAKSKPAR